MMATPKKKDQAPDSVELAESELAAYETEIEELGRHLGKLTEELTEGVGDVDQEELEQGLKRLDFARLALKGRQKRVERAREAERQRKLGELRDQVLQDVGIYDDRIVEAYVDLVDSVRRLTQAGHAHNASLREVVQAAKELGVRAEWSIEPVETVALPKSASASLVAGDVALRLFPIPQWIHNAIADGVDGFQVDLTSTTSNPYHRTRPNFDHHLEDLKGGALARKVEPKDGGQ